MNKLNIKNWDKYSIEFLSVFFAVILAFTLNNWNENRKSRIAESKILVEIYNGLEKDLEDIYLNKAGHEYGIKSTIYFREMLAGKSLNADSFMIHYLNLTRDFISIQNTTGYETLKSKGLELIENDSLRTKIISLYEYNYNLLRKLEEEYFELQFQENYFKEINYSIAKNIKLNDDKLITGIKTPLEIEPDQEKIIMIYLWKMQVNRNFILQQYQAVEKKIELLKDIIKKELNQQ